MGQKPSENPGPMTRLAQAAIEAAEGIFAFLGPDDRVREAFPLPSAEERERWFQFWENDLAVWGKIMARVLGRIPIHIRVAGDDKRIMWSFDKIERFLDADDKGVDSFCRFLEVRFALRTFLPCLALRFDRPSKILERIVAHDNIYLLELVAQIDPTIIHHPKLYDLLNPQSSEVRRQRWELLSNALYATAEPVDRRNVKYGIAGFLRRVSTSRVDRLSVPYLFSKFNEFAVASGVAIENRDPDFTDDEQTFRKGSQRFANKLPSLS